jgi:hypothetical protein
VEAHDDNAPRNRAAIRASKRLWGMSRKGPLNSRQRQRI